MNVFLTNTIAIPPVTSTNSSYDICVQEKDDHESQNVASLAYKFWNKLHKHVDSL